MGDVITIYSFIVVQLDCIIDAIWYDMIIKKNPIHKPHGNKLSGFLWACICVVSIQEKSAYSYPGDKSNQIQHLWGTFINGKSQFFFVVLWAKSRKGACCYYTNHALRTKLHQSLPLFLLFLWCNTMTALQNDQLLGTTTFIIRSNSVYSERSKQLKTDATRDRTIERDVWIESSVELGPIQITRALYQGYHQSRAMRNEKHLINLDARDDADSDDSDDYDSNGGSYIVKCECCCCCFYYCY